MNAAKSSSQVELPNAARSRTEREIAPQGLKPVAFVKEGRSQGLKPNSLSILNGPRGCGKSQVKQESMPQGLKPTMITFTFAGDKSQAYPKTGLLHSL